MLQRAKVGKARDLCLLQLLLLLCQGNGYRGVAPSSHSFIQYAFLPDCTAKSAPVLTKCLSVLSSICVSRTVLACTVQNSSQFRDNISSQ